MTFEMEMILGNSLKMVWNSILDSRHLSLKITIPGNDNKHKTIFCYFKLKDCRYWVVRSCTEQINFNV